MTALQKQQVSVYALLVNLFVSGATLTYVRETEHRLTKVEEQVRAMYCEMKSTTCAAPR